MSSHLDDATIDRLAEPAAEGDEPSEAVAAHLESCAECRREVRLAGRLERELARVPRMRAPQALLQGVMRGVALGRAQRRRWVAAALAAAAASVALVGLFLASGGLASLALEALQVIEAAGVALGVAGNLWNVFPLQLVALAAVVLLGCAAVLGRVMARASGRPATERAT